MRNIDPKNLLSHPVLLNIEFNCKRLHLISVTSLIQQADFVEHIGGAKQENHNEKNSKHL